MSLAEGIRKHGFRKWYERRLLQSHGHLLLTFLSVIGVFAAFEGAWRLHGGPQQQLLNLGAGLLLAGSGLWALRRYLWLLHTAELAANQAECPQCATYGRLELLRSDASGNEVGVRCRHCGHAWHISA